MFVTTRCVPGMVALLSMSILSTIILLVSVTEKKIKIVLNRNSLNECRMHITSPVLSA